MKKRLLIAAIVVVAVLAYLTMTPVGALRLAITVSGHPVKAFTFEIIEEPFYDTSLDENQQGYSLDNPPVERATDSELVNWVVTKHGVFYTAEYHGWG